VKFLIDNQLPPALARIIGRELGSEAVHVADVGLQEATDAQLWEYASAAGLILISKDEDFVDMVLNNPTASLVWVRVGNCRRDFLLDVFRRAWPRILERLNNRDRFVEIR
jgi:predicted nuclease of predicted toxin-antitoxin system